MSDKVKFQKREYENVCHILGENPFRFSTHSSNLFDIKFFDIMSAKFWHSISKNLNNLID